MSTPEPDSPAPASRASVSELELFLTFASIGLQSFGGALAFIERTVVGRKRWMEPQEFVGLFGICQVLPGPTGISFCVLLGDRFRGLRGAAAALAGFILPPAVVVIALAALFQQNSHIPWVQGMLHGMGAAAIGLIIHTAARMSRTLKGRPAGIVVAGLTFAAIAIAHWPISTLVPTLGVASVWWAWRTRA